MELADNQQLTFNFDLEIPEIFAESKDELKLKIGEFDGPLDLLLYLIRQEQANIFDIPIAKITVEYLRYVNLMKTLDISVAGDFLVMAATLIEIKSKMLLPKEILFEEDEAIEDPRLELVNRLLEHQKFKNAAEMLWTKSTIEQSTFTRGKIESDENNGEVAATVFDLLKVFQKILARHKEEIHLDIERSEMSLSDMILRLKHLLDSSKELIVSKFFEQTNSKSELILAFLAVLEIVKSESVRLLQSKVFGEIVLRSA
jgi:segregation and condensation protein A